MLKKRLAAGLQTPLFCLKGPAASWPEGEGRPLCSQGGKRTKGKGRDDNERE